MSDFPLSSMFTAVYSAIVDAAQAVEGDAWATLRDRYFDVDKDGSFSPKTIKMSLSGADVDVPLFSLIKHNTMVVDELTVKFEIDLSGLEGGDIVGNLPQRFLGRRSAAQIEIKFKGADASEGVMLLDDKFQKTLRG